MKKIIEDFLKSGGYPAWQPKVVLFDMDGVLYNSMPNHASSWHSSMKDYGISISKEEAYMNEGMRGVEVIKKLVKEQKGTEIDDATAAEMYRKKSEYYAACKRADLIPGVKNLQEMIVRAGLRVGIVTGSGQKTLLDRILHDFQGLVSPEIFITANDVTKGKPNPEPYLAGMKMAGTAPWQTIVVENAPLGVRAAKAAGCFTIAVNTGPLFDSVLLNEHADLVVHTMDEVTALLPSLLN